MALCLQRPLCTKDRQRLTNGHVWLQAAVHAAVSALEASGEEEAEPPAGSMTVALMPHQRLALAWMLAREAESSVPWGGILGDDQVLSLLWPHTRVAH